MASAARNGAAAAALTVAVAVLALAGGGSAQLQHGFYKGKCNGSDVEAVVQSIVRARFARENPIVAYLLRMQFHECVINVRASERATRCPCRTYRTGWLINQLTWQLMN
jgi:peroxidase